MKNYMFHLFFLFIFNFGVCQEFKGSITYSLNIADDEKLSKGELSGYFKLAKENENHLSFVLDFNKNEMKFYSKATEIDGIDVSFSKAFSGVDGIYYRKLNETFVLNSMDNFVLGKMILKKDMKVDWKLQTETKKIQDFLCYKASAKIKYNNGVGDFQKELIVWYCPSIPYSYGPKGYGGLPGIILEFQENNITIGAKKIEFNKEVSIVEPIGKTITLDEYEKLLQEAFKNENN